MKKITLCAAAITLTCIQACSQNDGYVVKGEIKGLEGKVYLTTRQNLLEPPMDSAEVVNGKFTLRGGPVEEVAIRYLNLNGDNVFRSFFLENGTIKVSGDAESFFYAEVSGTQNNRGLTDLLRLMRPINDSIQSIIKEAAEVWTGGDTTKAGHYGALFMEQRALYQKTRQSVYEKNQETEFGVFLLNEQAGSSSTTFKIDSLIALIPQKLMNSPFAKKMVELRASLVNVDPGVTPPDVALPSLDGNIISLSSLRGQYVLLDFWASWCGPCRGEIPHLKKVYEKYHGSGFEIFSVSLDDKRDAWIKALEEEQMPWIQVSDLKGMKSQVVTDYSITGIPAVWFIDKDGVILAKDVRGPLLDEKLREVFGY